MKKIHACPNDCILYRRDLVIAEICLECGLSRWKHSFVDVEGRKKIPPKILRWFPLKPRLQRLFLSSKTASSMTWHEDIRLILLLGRILIVNILIFLVTLVTFD